MGAAWRGLRRCPSTGSLRNCAFMAALSLTQLSKRPPMQNAYTTPPRDPPGTNPPRYVRERRGDATWIGSAIAIAVVLGLGFWALAHRTPTNTAANPPAVRAAPAPAADVPALVPQ